MADEKTLEERQARRERLLLAAEHSSEMRRRGLTTILVRTKNGLVLEECLDETRWHYELVRTEHGREFQFLPDDDIVDPVSDPESYRCVVHIPRKPSLG